MLQAERYKMICAHVQKLGAVRVTELSQLFQVSQETIRRDLTKLEQNKKLTRSFGGGGLSRGSRCHVRGVGR